MKKITLIVTAMLVSAPYVWAEKTTVRTQNPTEATGESVSPLGTQEGKEVLKPESYPIKAKEHLLDLGYSQEEATKLIGHFNNKDELKKFVQHKNREGRRQHIKRFLHRHPEIAAEVKKLRESGAERGEVMDYLKEARKEHQGNTEPGHHQDKKKGLDRAIDRVEDHMDRHEDKRDKLEDVRDHLEDVRDRKEDRFDRREDRRDYREDVRDKREDVWDAKHDGGKWDKIEDRFDRREDRFDRKEDRWDRREDVRDRREDRRDKKEDRYDRREDRRDRRENYRDRKEEKGNLENDIRGPRGRDVEIKEIKAEPIKGGRGGGPRGGRK